MNGIFEVQAPGIWALPNDELWLALIKPPLAALRLIEDDSSRPRAIEFARALFDHGPNGEDIVALNARGRNGVVLFPEFAFGSDDFEELDRLVRQQVQPIMVFAGFGAVTGDRLIAHVKDGFPLCGWQSGLAVIDRTKRYNAAWCWIHDPRQQSPNHHRCFVILKNWPEQRHERIIIPDFAGGTDIVRIITDDCTIFPTICADILCGTANCAQDRIAASIRANVDRNAILIPLLMLEGRPSSPAWAVRLGSIIQAAPQRVGIVICNHETVPPIIEESDDKFRCLSGALVSVAQFSKHNETPDPVRPITVAGIAGYVLRSAAPGIIAGDFTWREIGLSNRFIWLPNMRRTLEGDSLLDHIPSAVRTEMLRWCRRVSRPGWLDLRASGMIFLEAGYARIASALKSRELAGSIWPEALTGRGLDKKFDHRLDDAGSDPAVRSALDVAFLMAGSIFQAPGYLFDPINNAGHFYRPGHGECGPRDVIIWSSPDKLSDHQSQILKEAALNGVYKRATVVVARAAGGMSSHFTRVKADSITDVGNGPPPEADGEITEPSQFPVFLMSSGEIDSLLGQPGWEELPQEHRLPRIGESIKALLDRAA